MSLVEQEAGGHADYVRRGRQQQLLGTAHTGGQHRDDGKHVLQRVDESDERHHRHGQRVVVPRLDHQLRAATRTETSERSGQWSQSKVTRWYERLKAEV